MKNLYIIANFGEFYLKGSNISFFEKKLYQNLLIKIKNIEDKIVFEKKNGGSFFIKLKEGITEEDKLFLEQKIKKTFGFSNYYFAKCSEENNMDHLKKTVLDFLEQENFEGRNIKTFAIQTKKVLKNEKIKTDQVNKQIGSFVYEYLENKFKDVKVNLYNPDFVLRIKIRNDKVFVYSDIKKASGGMPSGTLGSNISLLSGGFDSPVASFLAQKRGLETFFIHFHSVPKTDERSIEKVKKLALTLAEYQGYGKLFLISIIDIQKDIVLNTERKYSVILQRRAFVNLAESISEKFKLNATSITTGDSLGQVASQTLENIISVSEKADNKKFILRPLICYDKEEIISLSKKIGTYKISELPHEDSCELFVPDKPETRSNLENVKEQEKKLNKKLIQEAVEKVDVIDF